MEIEGKLIEKHPVVQVGAKNSDKMSFVIEKKGKYPDPVYFETFNADLMKFMEDTAKGTELLVKFDVKSRFWDEGKRWFTTAMAWRAEIIRSDDSSGSDRTTNDGSGQPIGNNPIDQSADDSGDLPF